MNNLFLELNVTGVIEKKLQTKTKTKGNLNVVFERKINEYENEIKKHYGRLPRKQFARHLFAFGADVTPMFLGISFKIIIKHLKDSPESFNHLVKVLVDIVKERYGFERKTIHTLLKTKKETQKAVFRYFEKYGEQKNVFWWISNWRLLDLDIPPKEIKTVKLKNKYLMELKNIHGIDLHKVPKKQLKASQYDGEYTVRFLESYDPTSLLLGDMTHCCQHLGGVGESCVIAGIQEPQSGFLVVEKGNELKAQAWVWESKDGSTLVLDSLESADFADQNKIKQEIEKWAEQSPYRFIVVGTNSGVYQDRYEEKMKRFEEFPFEYNGYSDSRSVIYLKGWLDEMYYEFELSIEQMEAVHEYRKNYKVFNAFTAYNFFFSKETFIPMPMTMADEGIEFEEEDEDGNEEICGEIHFVYSTDLYTGEVRSYDMEIYY